MSLRKYENSKGAVELFCQLIWLRFRTLLMVGLDSLSLKLIAPTTYWPWQINVKGNLDQILGKSDKSWLIYVLRLKCVRVLSIFDVQHKRTWLSVTWDSLYVLMLHNSSLRTRIFNQSYSLWCIFFSWVLWISIARDSFVAAKLWCFRREVLNTKIIVTRFLMRDLRVSNWLHLFNTDLFFCVTKQKIKRIKLKVLATLTVHWIQLASFFVSLRLTTSFSWHTGAANCKTCCLFTFCSVLCVKWFYFHKLLALDGTKLHNKSRQSCFIFFLSSNFAQFLIWRHRRKSFLIHFFLPSTKKKKRKQKATQIWIVKIDINKWEKFGWLLMDWLKVQWNERRKRDDIRWENLV